MAAIIKPHIRIVMGVWKYSPARLGPYAWPTAKRRAYINNLNNRARDYCLTQNEKWWGWGYHGTGVVDLS